MASSVAVVLCTFNGAQFIREQLFSILGQSLAPDEIVILDDGSTDGTLDIVEEVRGTALSAATGARWIVEQPEEHHVGPSRNFQRALELTCADLVAWSDQDDIWTVDRLRVGVEYLRANPDVDVVASNATLVDELGEPLGITVFESQRVTEQELVQFKRGLCRPALLRRNIVPGMTFTFRRIFAIDVFPLPDGVIHDYALAAVAGLRDRLMILDEPLVAYRMHSSNAIGMSSVRHSIALRLWNRAVTYRDPLPDLELWVFVSAFISLIQLSDESLREVLEKTEFERRRRFSGLSLSLRIQNVLWLLRKNRYVRFSRAGRLHLLRDLFRRSV